MPIHFLVIYHLIFWWSFYWNPYKLCTSELASTYFPHWLWMGRKWQATDDIYYKYPACIPFLSMWYPPKVILSKLSRWLSHDNAFRLFSYDLLGHSLLASVIAYVMFRQSCGEMASLFGAITLTYSAYMIKPQTPAFMYTACWMPGMLIGGWFSVISCGMAILGGYWPILVYFMPVAVILNPLCLLGVFLGLPQIIPFLWYWPKSVRSGSNENTEYTLNDPKIGRLPIWKLKDLFIPTEDIGPTNGVHYPEVAMYMGIAVLFIWQVSYWWIPCILSILISIGCLSSIQRIPARVLYLLTISIAFLASSCKEPFDMTFLVLQGLVLLSNSSIYPSFPFSQWWDRPSRLYASESDYHGYPHFSGYLNGIKVKDYVGGFSLK